MFESLFGAEMPLAIRFFLAFLIVLGLIGATAWPVRRFGSGRLGGAGTRGRQPRLAVIDAASVDGRRRLILIRRDNVEHLLMIGGPTDVVVEPNIVRASAGDARGRRRRVRRPVPEALPRAIAVAGQRLQRLLAAAAGADDAVASECRADRTRASPAEPPQRRRAAAPPATGETARAALRRRNLADPAGELPAPPAPRAAGAPAGAGPFASD